MDCLCLLASELFLSSFWALSQLYIFHLSALKALIGARNILRYTFEASKLIVLSDWFTWRRVYGRFGSEFIVKVGHIILSLELGKEGGLHPPLQHLIPLDPGEEPVLLYGLGVLLPGTEPLLHGPVEQPLDDVLGVGGQVVLELELASEDPLRDGFSVVAGKWRRSSQHVVDQDAKTPPVHLLSMPTVENKQNQISTKLLYFGWRENKSMVRIKGCVGKIFLPGFVNNLGSHVLHCAAKCIVELLVGALLDAAEVSELDVTISNNEIN